MIRLVSYPIARPFTSLAMAAMLLFSAPSLWAQEATVTAHKTLLPVEIKTEVVGFADEAGNTLFLHDFKGKVAIINLWASWCAPCVREMPSLAALQRTYKKKGLVVLALAEDDDHKAAFDFFKSHSLTGLSPFIDTDHHVWMALDVRGLPTTVIVGKNGQIAERIEGPVDWTNKAVKQGIEKLLAAH